MSLAFNSWNFIHYQLLVVKHGFKLQSSPNPNPKYRKVKSEFDSKNLDFVCHMGNQHEPNLQNACPNSHFGLWLDHQN